MPSEIDLALLWSTLMLLLIGMVMVYSASMATAEAGRMTGNQPAYFLFRHAIFLTIGLVAAAVAFQVPMSTWQQWSPWLFVAGFVLLALVLIPGVGRDVNGARRWLPLGIVNLQPSELMKLFAVLYAADYTTRKMAHLLLLFIHIWICIRARPGDVSMTAMMDLLGAARATAGTLVGENVTFCGVSTDSRSIAAGELFVALRGEHYDGHAYVATAAQRGAAAAIVAVDAAKGLQSLKLPLVQVAETRLSLGALAADWRSRFTLPLIAVTGSNGKTTTKEMIASILKAAFGDAVLATQGNYNNDIGLPLTLLRLNASHRAAIIELGMNHPGEIAYLAGIGRPTVALVTNAQRAHLAGMGSLAAIAAEKGSIYSGLDEMGVAVVNADDPWSEPVSYTHLDVYKRQTQRGQSAGRRRRPD